MVHHIVLWNFLPELSVQEKKEAGAEMKKSLLAVKEKAAGVIALDVVVKKLESCNKELALISSFETVEALNAYQVHPEHIKAAGFIKSVTCERVCFDYEQ